VRRAIAPLIFAFTSLARSIVYVGSLSVLTDGLGFETGCFGAASNETWFLGLLDYSFVLRNMNSATSHSVQSNCVPAFVGFKNTGGESPYIDTQDG
jgi:hypothetical protein